MNRTWELCVKFFLALLFAPAILFYAIHLIAALLQVIASFVAALLPVLIVAVLALGIPVALFIMHTRRSVSRLGNGNVRTPPLGNPTVRRPREMRGRDDGH